MGTTLLPFTINYGNSQIKKKLWRVMIVHLEKRKPIVNCKHWRSQRETAPLHFPISYDNSKIKRKLWSVINVHLEKRKAILNSKV